MKYLNFFGGSSSNSNNYMYIGIVILLLIIFLIFIFIIIPNISNITPETNTTPQINSTPETNTTPQINSTPETNTTPQINATPETNTTQQTNKPPETSIINECKPGYNYQGIDSNSEINKNICVKNCSEYNMQNINGVCFGKCPDGYDESGTSCKSHTYTVPPTPAKLNGPRGTTYISNCNNRDRLCVADCIKHPCGKSCLGRICITDCIKHPCGKTCTDGACKSWDNCESGYNKTAGGICTWVGGASCSEDKQLKGALCYDICRDDYSMNVAGICTKNGPLTVQRPNIIPELYNNN